MFQQVRFRHVQTGTVVDSLQAIAVSSAVIQAPASPDPRWAKCWDAHQGAVVYVKLNQHAVLWGKTEWSLERPHPRPRPRS